MQELPIFGLGYVIVRSSALEEWREFAEEVLGMMAVTADDGTLLLRMDDRVARVVIDPSDLAGGHPADELGLTAGWECRSEEAFHQVRRLIEDEGIKTIHSAESRPWCRESFECVDPNGLHCEFFYGGKVDPAQQFVSSRGVTFVSGHQAMGHLTLASSDVDAGVDFYRRVLGFQVRETKTVAASGRLAWAFLSPNAREHSLALIAREQTRILHLLVEATELDAVGRAMDQCLAGRAYMTASLGRHWNDKMVSFYVRTPSGFDVEYGFGGTAVEPEQWTRVEQGGSGLVSLWGHRVVQPDGTLGRQIGQH